LFFIIPPNVYSTENNPVITISTDGEAKVTQNFQTKTTISSITIQSMSDKISNIIATDERGIILATSQNDSWIRIDTLGASTVNLSYSAEIISKVSGIWKISFESNKESTVILPPLSNIVSVNNIPIDITDDGIIMPPGKNTISYTIKDVTTKNFVASVNDVDYPIQIMTGSQVDGFSADMDSILFNVDYNAPILLIIPKALISDPFEISLNNNQVDSKQYYQNNTHSWIRIEPQEAGSIKVAETISKENISEKPQGGGCLIATATYGSELAPQVQQLRELRDNTLLQTNSGSSFMSVFNQIYYTFSPAIADLEREHPVFRETVNLAIIPLISSLSILNYVDMDSEAEVLGYGISLIVLNVGMYFVAPAIIITKLVNRRN